jgi:methylmalonyl-CoA mutase N-terminal domain/subunit
MEKEARKYIKKLDVMGGMVSAIEKGFPQGEIHRAAVVTQEEIDQGEQIIVGVNAFVDEKKRHIPTLKIKEGVERAQVVALRKIRNRRNKPKLTRTLHRLQLAAEEGAYLMPLVLDAIRSSATVGEISDLFRSVYGEYRENGPAL